MSVSDEDAQHWEANLLLAEKVAGWRWIEGDHPLVPLPETPRWLVPPWMEIEDIPANGWTTYDYAFHVSPGRHLPARDDRLTLESVPRYTQEIAVAWQLLERFVAVGCRVSVEFDPLPPVGGWACQIDHSGGGVRYEGQETAQLSICQAAALAAKRGLLRPREARPSSTLRGDGSRRPGRVDDGV